MLATLRAGIDRLEGAGQEHRHLPVLPALAELLPGGGLRRGGSYAVTGSTGLALALLAGPAAEGAWCGVVGLPALGVPAAAELGIELSRLVLVPAPGPQWLTATATLLDAFDVVVVAPPADRQGARPSDGEVRRLSARVREREAVLLVLGSWPGCVARLTVRGQQWTGLGVGHGRLTARRLDVEVSGRGGAGRPRRAALWLPAPEGSVRLAGRPVQPVEAGTPVEPGAPADLSPVERLDPPATWVRAG